MVDTALHVTAYSFGQLLKEYREQLGLSQRKLASYLGVDESTIARVEIGVRKPPQKTAFYERLLNNVPGITRVEVAALMAAEDAPQWGTAWLADEASDSNQPQRTDKFALAEVPGVQVTLHVRATDPDQFTQMELDALGEVAKREVQLGLSDFLARRDQRARHHPVN